MAEGGAGGVSDKLINGMPAGAAASAVLIYRLLTYWLTIPVGWVGLKMAERRGYV